jgi:hypothetical protein
MGVATACMVIVVVMMRGAAMMMTVIMCAGRDVRGGVRP